MRNNLSRIGLVAAALAGTIGLILFAQFILNRREPRRYNPIVKHELVVTYFPLILIEFAKRHPAIKTHDEMAFLIEQEGLRKYWFVSVARSHFQDGVVREEPAIWSPGKFYYQFPQTRAFLQTAAGNPPDEWHAQARVVIIEACLAVKEPMEALEELLER